MTSTSTASKSQNIEEEVELIVRAKFTKAKFKPHPKIVVQTDNMGAFSSIPNKLLLTEDVRAYIHYKIGEVGDFKTIVAYQQICDTNR